MSITAVHTDPVSFGVHVPLNPGTRIPDGLARACLAAKTAAENKGQDVLVLDLRRITPVFDFFVIATGASRRQVHTIVEECDAALRSVGDTRAGVEGYDASKWVVQDYGDVLVHVFDPDTRSYYSLEDLWADAKKVDWQAELEDPGAHDEAIAVAAADAAAKRAAQKAAAAAAEPGPTTPAADAE